MHLLVYILSLVRKNIDSVVWSRPSILSILRVQRNVTQRHDWHLDYHLAAIRLSHLHIMLTFSSVLVYDAEAARLLSANSLLRARLCASQFSRIRSGTLKADNRMRNINHSIHLISAIIYTAPFARRPTTRARLNGRNRMRWSNKIFTISNKLSRHRTLPTPSADTNITDVFPWVTSFFFLRRLNSALGSSGLYKNGR